MLFNKVITIIITICVSLFSMDLSDFPLWGSTWVFGEGKNPNIYTSVAPFSPNKAAKVTFLDDKSGALISYSNVESNKFYGTSECVQKILIDWTLERIDNENIEENSFQFDLKHQYALEGKVYVPYEEINKKYGALHIKYKPYDDTLWSIASYAKELLDNGYDSCEIQIGSEIKMYYSSDNISEYYVLEKPKMKAFRGATRSDIQKYQKSALPSTYKFEGEEQEQTVYYFSSGDLSEPAEYDHLKITGSTASAGISAPVMVEHKNQNYQFKTDNLGFWQIHITPEVWWYPRRKDEEGTGLFYDAYKKSHREAMRLREQSLSDVSDPNLKRWRSPVISDSASTIISCSFIGEPIQNSMSKIPLTSDDPIVSQKYGHSKIYYNHIPRRAYRVDSTKYGNYADRVALLQLSTKNDTEEEQSRNIPINCYGWEETDKANAAKIFPWKHFFTNGGGVGGQGNSGHTGGYVRSKRVRDWNVDDGVYMYDGCPVSEEYLLGDMTVVEARKYLYMQYPTFSKNAIYRAERFFNVLATYLTEENDRIMAEKKVKTGQILYSKILNIYENNPQIQDCENCPVSWLDNEEVSKILKRNYGL